MMSWKMDFREVLLCAAFAVVVIFPHAANAQDGRLPWEEYGRLIEKGRGIAPLDAASMFGDSVDLYTGALSFSHVDVSIPGNSAIPVAVGRRMSVYDRDKYSSAHDYAFADWDIDIPNINGVFATDWHVNRCSQPTPPSVNAGIIPASEYWSGIHADLPGGGEVLIANASWPKPSGNLDYRYVTAGNVYFSCLPSILNGFGEGFLAISDDGTRYWLNHMAQYVEPRYSKPSAQGGVDGPMFHTNTARKKNALYVTRVEDRFGNWVVYTYANQWNRPVKLTGISSSDGRSLTLSYNSNGYVSSVSDGQATWSYQYAQDHLSAVILPDASRWSMALSGLSDATMLPSTEGGEYYRDCFSLDITLASDHVGSLTHPSGAVAEFTVADTYMGRTNVPGICNGYQPRNVPGSDTRDDFPVAPFQWAALAIKKKRITGPGLTPMVWNYGFTSHASWVFPVGETEPVCRTLSCMDAICTSDSCAGTRTALITLPNGGREQYVFGNSYRYNEGKLLSHAISKDGVNLSATSNTYLYPVGASAYPVKLGSSPQSRSVGFVSEYPRPLIRKDVTQDGVRFSWAVDTGCPGSYCLDSFVRPIRVVRQSATAASTAASMRIGGTHPPVLHVPEVSETGNYIVSWSAVSGFVYELRERKNGGEWQVVHVSEGEEAAVGAKGDGIWEYSIRSCGEHSCGEWSDSTYVLVPSSEVRWD